VAAGEAFAVEDSPNGITAAKRAGMKCVAVPNPITERLDLSHADVLVRSLADVSLDEVIEKLKP
jgi:beta-phosphoglucomutase-like phosphatase (HAD superfamily)